MLAVGCTGSNNDNIASQSSSSQSTETVSQDSVWANDASNSAMIFTNDTAQITNAANNKDFYTASSACEKYKQDIATEIKNTDNFTVSPDLQGCKDEYKLALLNDYNAATFMNSGMNQLTSGDLGTSAVTTNMGTEELRLANSHYDNVTLLMKAYNNAHPNSQIELKIIHHNVDPIENSTNEVATTEQSSADEPVGNVDTSESTKSADSSTSNIFDYCTWQAETTKKIGEYNEESENKSYAVVTLKINNTGDQTYSTNPNYWHLKIGDMYYQPDSATYDSSLNHMTTDVGPGGKITTKIAYLVDGEPSINDMDMYYDGPGSDGTIHS
jgi:Telomeric repeat-binding factor 2.